MKPLLKNNPLIPYNRVLRRSKSQIKKRNPSVNPGKAKPVSIKNTPTTRFSFQPLICIPETLLSAKGKEYILLSRENKGIRVIQGQSLIDYYVSSIQRKYGKLQRYIFFSQADSALIIDTGEKLKQLWKATKQYKRVQRAIPPVTQTSRILRVLKSDYFNTRFYLVKNQSGGSDDDLIVTPRNKSTSIREIKNPLHSIQTMASQISRIYCAGLNTVRLPFHLQMTFIEESKNKWVFLNSKPTEQTCLYGQTQKIKRRSRGSVLQFSRYLYEQIDTEDSCMTPLRTYLKRILYKTHGLKPQTQSEKIIPEAQKNISDSRANNVIRSAADELDIALFLIKHRKQEQGHDRHLHRIPISQDFIQFLLQQLEARQIRLPLPYRIDNAPQRYKLMQNLLGSALSRSCLYYIKNIFKDKRLSISEYEALLECIKVTMDEFYTEQRVKILIIERLQFLKHLIICQEFLASICINQIGIQIKWESCIIPILSIIIHSLFKTSTHHVSVESSNYIIDFNKKYS